MPPRGGSRPRRWGLLALGFATGLAATAAGAGLGPRHVAEEGATPTAVTGLGVLVGGAGLTVLTVVLVLRAVTRRRWWPVILAATVTAAYVALWTLGQAVAASYPPHPELGGRTPAALGLTYRDVTFSSADGVTLAGWYLPSSTGAAVAVMHGAGSTRSAVLEHAAVLARNGYGVLLFDARGHGASTGRGMDFGWYGELDASAAVDFLTSRPDVAPGRIGLVGLSMGGEEAIGAAGADPRVAAVVAEGATHRVASDKGYLAAYGIRGDLQQGLDRITYWLCDVLSDAPEPPALRRSVAIADRSDGPAPVLLVTAGNVPDEALAARYVRAASPGTVETWDVPGVGHTRALSQAPRDWEEHVIAFLDDALAPPGR